MEQELDRLLEGDIEGAWSRFVPILRESQNVSGNPERWRVPEPLGRAFARRHLKGWAFLERVYRLKQRPLPSSFESICAYELLLFTLDEFVKGTVGEAWARCFSLWRVRGRVDDHPRGVRYGSYVPGAGKLLGRRFAARFHEQRSFLIERLECADPVEELCAYEVLEEVALGYLRGAKWRFDELPGDLRDLRRELPRPILDEVRGEPNFSEFEGHTISDLFSFLASRGSS